MRKEYEVGKTGPNFSLSSRIGAGIDQPV